MQSVNSILGFLDIGIGLLLIAISIPLLRGFVSRNTFYGFRFRQSFESEAKWQQINKHCYKACQYCQRWQDFATPCCFSAYVRSLREEGKAEQS